MAIVTKTIKEGSSVQAEQVTSDKVVSHSSLGGSKVVPVNSWIVYHAGGVLEILDNTTFMQRYS
ncbi:MAG: hypothetical protein KGH87_09600 [Thaumarchaeota archaeon]|nr:hypothetical protein [Nitrososphaerota archaeon]MDE1840159.1 hypothetical protein [Nitrososphaerota archaeon]